MQSLQDIRDRDDWPQIRAAAQHGQLKRIQQRLLIGHPEARALARMIRDDAGPLASREAKAATVTTTHLVIPDTHVEAGQSLARFDQLARLIAKFEPDHIIHLGDFNNCGSLSRHDIGKHHAWNKLWNDDKAACHAALDYIKAGCERECRGGYSPTWHITLGNHDWYPERLGVEIPALKNSMSYKDWEFERLFDRVIPYLTPHVVDGILYQHCMVGATGRALGGVTLARGLLNKFKTSVIVGHSHTKMVSESFRADTGQKMLSLVGGCFFPLVPLPKYMTPVGAMRWWSGVHLIHGVENGYGDLEHVSAARLRRQYGG